MRSGHILIALICASFSIAAAAPKQPVRLICKDQPKAMGSRLVERVCRTRADWDAMRDFARRAAADAADKPPNENGLRTTLQ